MSKRRNPNPEFDLFIPALGDLPLKDQWEVMERPFFSLQKRKRLKPIEYRSPDGEAWVRVQAIPDYGMATIWDADILIWAASTLNRMKQQGINDLPRTLTTTPYDLLRAIKRSTGGRDYQELQAALLRLQTTFVIDRLRKLLGAVNVGHAFQLANVAYLRTIGFALLGSQLVTLAQRVATLQVTGVSETTSPSIDLKAYVGIAVIFVLAEVFRQGTQLQDDAAMTV